MSPSSWKSPGFYFVSTIIRLMRHKFFYGQQGDAFWDSVRRSRTPRGSRPNGFRCTLLKLLGLRFQEETFENQSCFFLTPRKWDASEDFTVLYIHGGGYVNEALDTHWDFLGRVAFWNRARIVLPQYPLAPEFTCEDVLPVLLAAYKQILKDVHQEKIFVMGDSAGGGLALSLLMTIREQGLPQPKQGVLISPSVELSVPDFETDSQARALEARDIMLSFRSFPTLLSRWRGTLDATDWRVQPYYGTLEGLAPLLLFTGTDDILNRCARLFREKAEKEGFPLEFVEYPEMFHCWLLLPIWEGWSARRKIYSLMRRSKKEKGSSKTQY